MALGCRAVARNRARLGAPVGAGVKATPTSEICRAGYLDALLPEIRIRLRAGLAPGDLDRQPLLNGRLQQADQA